jgi:hypothetical protein
MQCIGQGFDGLCGARQPIPQQHAAAQPTNQRHGHGSAGQGRAPLKQARRVPGCLDHAFTSHSKALQNSTFEQNWQGRTYRNARQLDRRNNCMPVRHPRPLHHPGCDVGLMHMDTSTANGPVDSTRSCTRNTRRQNPSCEGSTAHRCHAHGLPEP